MPASTPNAPPLDPTPGRSLLELVGLSGLTITQPLLATFGQSPDFFVFREASSIDIVAFALLIALVPGLIAWACSLAAGLVADRARVVVHELALGGFLAIGVLQLAAATGLAPGVGMALALLAAVTLVVGRRRWSGLRQWLAWLAPVPALFVALFLFASPVSALVTAEDVDPAELGAFASGDPPPVVVMVFDEWPLTSIVRTDGTIDEQVAPNVARLADRSTWYRNATTVANLTNFAVPPILTGNLPRPGDRPEASNQPENLFTLLGGNYKLDAHESITRLCPVGLCATEPTSAGERAAQLADLLDEARSVLGDRLWSGAATELVTDGFVEPEAAIAEARSDGETFNLDELLAPRPERLDEFIDGIEEDEYPTVHYVHVLGPHTPHRHTPAGVRYPSDGTLRLISQPDGSEDSDLRADAPWPARLDRQRLLLEVGYVDRLVGDVLDHLEETGLYDDALVVLTSDHGLAFEPGASARGIGDRKVERSIEADLLWVPLLIKAPGQDTGAVSDVDARTIDVVPTVAGLLGIDLPWTVDGVDLSAGEADRGAKEFVRVQGSSFAVFALDDPVAVRADLDEVLALGTDAHLAGSGRDRWWKVGPRPDLVGADVATLELVGPVDLVHRLDDPGAYDDVDVASGELPLLVSGRVEQAGGGSGPGGPVAVLVGDTVAAVVPTYDDGEGPGRFSAMIPPRILNAGDGRVRLAEVTERRGETVLGLIPEA